VGQKITAVKQVATALGDLWQAQNASDQQAAQAAIERGHAAVHPDQPNATRTS
jgi:hypothetical protein